MPQSGRRCSSTNGHFPWTDRCISSCAHSSGISQVPKIVFRTWYIHPALPFRSCHESVCLSDLMVVIATHLHQLSIILFPYLYDWFVKKQNLIWRAEREFAIRLLFLSTSYNQSEEVSYDFLLNVHVHKDGISISRQHSQNTSGQNSVCPRVSDLVLQSVLSNSPHFLSRLEKCNATVQL